MNEIFVNVLNEGTDMLAEQEEQALADLEAAGVEVIIPTDEERAAMSQFMMENIWPVFGEKFYGVEFMKGLEQYLQ